MDMLNNVSKIKRPSKIKYYLSGISFLASMISVFYLMTNNAQAKDISHLKNHQQVIIDAESLNADVSILKKSYYNKFARLLFPEDEPVYVIYDNSMPDREKKIITNTVKYYNDIFSDLDGNYRFELVDEKYPLVENNITITIKNKKLNLGVQGLNEGTLENKFNQGIYITDSFIYIDWEKAQEMDDLGISYTIVHEFAHSLGLKDVYINEYNCYNINTIMNVANVNCVDIIYPSDYILLQSLYSDSYKNYENYEDAVNEMKEEIEEYRDHFYEYYTNIIKDKYPQLKNLDESYIKQCQKIEWNGKNAYGDNYKCVLTPYEDYCDLTLFNEKGEIVDSSNGIINWSNGMYFIEGLEIDKTSYMTTINSEHPYKFTLAFYKDENDNILINDNLGSDAVIARVTTNLIR